MLTGITLEVLGITSAGDELIRFLNGAKGKATYGLRVVNGEIEPLSNRQAELLYEEMAHERRQRSVEVCLPPDPRAQARMVSLQVQLFRNTRSQFLALIGKGK